MIVPLPVRQRFAAIEPHLRALKKLVDDTLAPWCEARSYAYHSRVKELPSLAEKIETGKFGSWDSLDDLIACAVVVPTHSHEPPVLDFLDARFQQSDLKRRGELAKPPDAFRFDSTRWRGRLRPHPHLSRPQVDALVFEVQVRTAFEHAWNATTHDLTYKGTTIDWRRTRLVAQLKAAVEQIDMLIDGFEQGADLVHPFPWREFHQQVELQECYTRKFDAGLIDAALAPKDWIRFAQNLLALIFASAPSRRRRDEHFDGCLKVLKDANAPLPLSCSLLQGALGTLADAGLVKQLDQTYAPLVTPELETFFPATKAITQRFQI